MSSLLQNGEHPSPPPAKPKSESIFEEYEDDTESPRVIPVAEDPVDCNGKAINLQPEYDRLISLELSMPQGEVLRSAKVIGRTQSPDGKCTGTYNHNPIMNTMTYDVEFPDGEIREYAANIIAENMLSQVDNEGYTLQHLSQIVDASSDDSAVSKSALYCTTKRGNRRMRHTTCGWKMLVRWKDNSETWMPLKDMKESYPIETAEFAKARGIDDEPAFAWWVPYTLRKRDVIVSQVKARCTRRITHKYGVELPKSIKHSELLDRNSKSSLWSDALTKEMFNVGVAFEILEDSQNIPVGWNKATGHLIWDVKIDGTRKARWVLDGHRTQDPEHSTYAGVVSRESVRIALTYAALNDIDVNAADIRNAYLQAPTSEKHYIVCGLEFGLENVGKRALIRRALYGGKSAGRDFRNHLRECMNMLHFKSCPADPDVWMRPATKSDGSKYWEYVLLYVDDVLIISEHGEAVLRGEIGKHFKLKEESIGPPSFYLGGKLRKVSLDNGTSAWAFGSSKYIQASVDNIELYLKNRNSKLPSRCNTPTSTNYRPELDTSKECNPEDATHFQSLIGVLRWIVELGRVDICCEVSMLSSSLALPREGHLEQVYHIFAYLKKYHNAEMVFDPSDPGVEYALFPKQDWSNTEFDQDEKEEIPQDMPETRGRGFVIRAYVDADHAGDCLTRRSRTGFLVYLNSAPVYWSSKKQGSCETSTFGSEFMAMKQCCEYLRGLRYKLRMMGIPVDLPSFVFGDNQSVLYNTTLPDSTLKKKSLSIAYHFVREGACKDEWRTAYINTHLNPADLLTKPLPGSEKRMNFVRMVLHHLFG